MKNECPENITKNVWTCQNCPENVPECERTYVQKLCRKHAGHYQDNSRQSKTPFSLGRIYTICHPASYFIFTICHDCSMKTGEKILDAIF